VTTRKPRAGEVEGRDYIFVSPSEFRRKIREGEFLEWARVFGQYYGTPTEGVRRELERGRDVILAIDVHGAREIRRKTEAVTIFVMPPSMKDLEVRLRKRRSDSVSEIRKRLERARMEIACAKDYDYIVPNRNFRAAVRMLARILEKEKRMRTDERGG
jgi:guanylate kinase